MEQSPFCKLEIFAPQTHLEAIRAVLIRADAGRLGFYEGAISYAPVTGCWTPLPGASPYDGEVGKRTEAAEVKIEVLCRVAKLRETVALVREAHPYEEPVINAIPLLDTIPQ